MVNNLFSSAFNLKMWKCNQESNGDAKHDQRAVEDDWYYNFNYDEKWTKEEIAKMEEKFKEFQHQKADKSLRWDFRHRIMKFDIHIKERQYWELRFEDEYLKVIHEIPGNNPSLMVDIHVYVYYVKGKELLGSVDYPDEKNCLVLLREDVIYYNQDWNCVKKDDGSDLEAGRGGLNDDDGPHFDQCTKEIKDKIEEKFKKFQHQNADRSLSWDLGHRTIKFDDHLKEEEYWTVCFEEEYDHVVNEDSFSNPYLLADIHAYIYYATGKMMLESRYPDDKNCLGLLEKKIIYYNR